MELVAGPIDTKPRCGESTENLGYLYDGAWNLNAVTNHSSVTGYSVNSQNELTSVAGNSCSYDANGNLTGFSQGGYTYACTYDDENELATITSYYGGSNYQLSEMSYDGRGRPCPVRYARQHRRSGALRSQPAGAICDDRLQRPSHGVKVGQDYTWEYGG